MWILFVEILLYWLFDGLLFEIVVFISDILLIGYEIGV